MFVLMLTYCVRVNAEKVRSHVCVNARTHYNKSSCMFIVLAFCIHNKNIQHCFHIDGVDHIYWNHPSESFVVDIVDIYHSDHDAIFLSMPFCRT